MLDPHRKRCVSVQNIKLFRIQARIDFHAEDRFPQRVQRSRFEVGWEMGGRRLWFSIAGPYLAMQSSEDEFPTWQPSRNAVKERILWLFEAEDSESPGRGPVRAI